jgi:hypothetical protein
VQNRRTPDLGTLPDLDRVAKADPSMPREMDGQRTGG